MAKVEGCITGGIVYMTYEGKDYDRIEQEGKLDWADCDGYVSKELREILEAEYQRLISK